MSKISGIYKITNTKNGKVYVGQSKDVRNRWNEHKNRLLKNTHVNEHLQNAYNYYGLEYFSFEILENCSQEYINSREEFWISHYKSDDRKFGYNILGWINAKKIIPPEIGKKISEGNKGRQSWNEGMSNHLSEETKELMRNSHDKKGEKSGTSILTNEKVLKIVELYGSGNSAKQLGIDYGVAESTIYDICGGRSWSHITGIPKKERSERQFRDRRKQIIGNKTEEGK